LAKERGANDAAIGILFSVSGIGGIVGSLVGGQIQRRFSFGQVIIGTAWINLALFPLFALTPSWIWLGVVAALIATLGPVYNVVQFSYRLSLIPDELQGRVNSTFRLVAFGFMPVGAALSGVLIERFGATVAVWALAAGLLALTLVTTFNRDVRAARPIGGRTAPA
ncbi:MAG: MFS transporter, partial [Proteobacteria bacterium]|nr:MFS transporter [Pseudomonadota bacterium]